MSIGFDDIPGTLRVPVAAVEFNSTRAVSGTPDAPFKLMVIGQRLSATATVAAGVPTRIMSPDQAESAFGRGSMLAEMFRYLKAANKMVETWAIGLDDLLAGVKATGKISFTGPATKPGVLALYIAGQKISVGVSAADTATQVATAAIAAINANTRIPVVAAVDGTNAYEVNLTCRWKGVTGNDVDVRINYYPDDATPVGLAVAITAMASGAGNPDVTTALTALGDEWWNGFVMPYTDSTNLTAFEEELDVRFGPLRALDGVAFTGFRGTHSATGTFGDGRNSKLFSVMGSNLSPTPPWLWAAVNGVVAMASLNMDPLRPLQTLVLPGLLPPSIGQRWTLEERNLLLYSGISTFMVDAGGRVLIERQITTYQQNGLGVADTAYLNVNTVYWLSYIRHAMSNRIRLRFPRMKLANDDARFGAGQPIVTPKIVRMELLALGREFEDRGLLEDFEQYKADLIVERDSNNPDRLNVLMAPNEVNGLIVFAAQVQFIN
jgi:phage tail sheath gpL-like